MVQRLTYRRRHAFATSSNRVHKVKTPGGKLVFQYMRKKSNQAKCGDCHNVLQSIPAVRPKQYRNLAARQRTVARAYGGAVCATCVRQRIVRAFLIEEQKIVKAVLRQRGGAKKAAEPAEK